jgi:hypothetical protein
MPPENLFVLYPANRKFLTGDSRRIANRHGHALAGTIMGWLIIALGVAAPVLASRGWYTWLRLRQDGVTTSATVLKKFITINGDGDRSYHVRYRFEINGQPFEREGFASAENYGKAADRIEVMFSASDPAFSRIINQHSGEFPWIALLVGVGLAAFGFYLLRKVRRMNELARHGEVLSGRVLQCTGAEDADGDWIISLKYQFQAPDGRVLHGESQANRPDLRTQPPPAADTSVVVLFRDDEQFQVL